MNTINHPCNRCGQSFEPTATQIKKRHWRCPDCRSDDNRERYQRARAKKVKEPKVCTVCRAEFFPADTWDGRRQKTCGMSCRATASASTIKKSKHFTSAKDSTFAIDPDFDEGAYG